MGRGGGIVCFSWKYCYVQLGVVQECEEGPKRAQRRSPGQRRPSQMGNPGPGVVCLLFSVQGSEQPLTLMPV